MSPNYSLFRSCNVSFQFFFQPNYFYIPSLHFKILLLILVLNNCCIFSMGITSGLFERKSYKLLILTISVYLILNNFSLNYRFSLLINIHIFRSMLYSSWYTKDQKMLWVNELINMEWVKYKSRNLSSNDKVTKKNKKRQLLIQNTNNYDVQ